MLPLRLDVQRRPATSDGGVVDDVVVQESRRLDQLDRRTVAAQGIELSLRGLLPERRDAAPEAEPGTEQLAALEVLEQPVRQLGGLGRDPRLLAATPRELVTGDPRDPCDQPLIEVVQPLVDGGGVGGGHRGVLSHGPDDPPMPSWAAGPRRRFLPRTGPSPPPAVPPRRVPESARVCASPPTPHPRTMDDPRSGSRPPQSCSPRPDSASAGRPPTA